MPGSVANAAPTTVMPFTLCRAYQRSQQWPALVNEYRLGESQQKSLTSTSRKRWQVSKHIAAADVSELRTFFIACAGARTEFYFYDVYETSPLFSYDESGIETTGRYTVRFEGAWEQACSFGMGDMALGLVEIA